MPFNDEIYSSVRHGSGKEIERHTMLNRALERLNEGCRQIIFLAYVQGYSRREIAESLGIKEEAVRVRLFRCVRSVRAFLEGPGEPGGQHA